MHSRVGKILKINPKVDAKNIKEGQVLTIPYSYIKYPNEVLFVDKGFILPKNKGSRICSKHAPSIIKKKKISKLKILNVSIRSDRKLLKEKNVEFLIKFNAPVKIKGKPTLDIQARGSLGFAQYLKIKNKNTVVFKYSYDYELEKVGVFKVSIPAQKGKFLISSTSGKKFKNDGKVYKVGSSLVDQSPPEVEKYYPLRKGNYKYGDKITIDLLYNEKVFIKGKPTLRIYLDNKTVKANLSQVIGGKILRFHYRIKKQDSALKGVEINEHPDFENGHIRDWLNNKVLKSNKRVFLRDAKVIQNVVSVESIKLPQTKTYRFGEVMKFTLKFSSPVKVKGNPILELKIGENIREAHFLKSNSKWVSFTYKVTNYDYDVDGITIIPKINTGEGEILALNSIDVDDSISLPPTTKIKVDSGRAHVIHVHGPSKSGFKTDEEIQIVLEMNNVVEAREKPVLNIEVSGNKREAIFFKRRGAKLFFKYKIEEEDHGTGLKILSPIIAQEEGVVGENGNPIIRKFNSLSLPKIYVDTKRPRIQKVQYPKDEIFGYRDRVEFAFIFDEPVFIDGNPRLRIDLRSGKVMANYKSGSGSNRIEFEYSVHSTDRETGELILISPLETYHGSIKDKVGNDAVEEFREIYISSVKVDGGINYGLIRENQDGYKKSKDATVNNYESNYALDLVFSTTKMTSVEKLDGTTSRLNSSLDLGANFHLFFKWLPELTSDARIGLKRINFEEASNFKILNLENEYFELDLTTSYHIMHDFDFYLSMGIAQKPFIHAQGTSLLIIDPIAIHNSAIGADVNFWHFRNLSFGINAESRYYNGRSSDNFELSSGVGTKMGLYIDNFSSASKFKLEFYRVFHKQNSNIFEHKTVTSGFLFQYHFSGL